MGRNFGPVDEGVRVAPVTVRGAGFRPEILARFACADLPAGSHRLRYRADEVETPLAVRLGIDDQGEPSLQFGSSGRADGQAAAADPGWRVRLGAALAGDQARLVPHSEWRQLQHTVRALRRKASQATDANAQLRTKLQNEKRNSGFLQMSIAHLREELSAANERQLVPQSSAESLNYLFVMAFQRSGSTLLQVLLNSIPGLIIRGENGGMLANLYRFHRTGQEQRAVRREFANAPGFPFFGINDYPDQPALDSVRELMTRTLLRPRPDTHTIGFKEVNWWVDDLADYVAFIREVFPGARIIVNVRNVEDAAKSRWHAKDPEAARKLAERRDLFLQVTEPLGDDRFVLRYDDYKDEPANLKPLFDWLGADFDLATITRLMETRYA